MSPKCDGNSAIQSHPTANLFPLLNASTGIKVNLKCIKIAHCIHTVHTWHSHQIFISQSSHIFKLGKRVDK